MAFHGGGLEEVTDEIAIAAAERAGASIYAVVQPGDLRWHIPSHEVTADQSTHLAEFFAHVDVVVAVHGYGRPTLFRSLLIGGRNRVLAEHLAVHLIPRLHHYEVIADIDKIPSELRGLHPDNPVNVARGGGVQLELPPRVRGKSPIWTGFKGNRVPHTEALVDGLAAAATSWKL